MPTNMLELDWMYPTLAGMCKLLEMPLSEPEIPETAEFDDDED